MRTPLFAAGALVALVLAITDASAAGSVPKYITAAVADSARPEADQKRDADRKPAECLAFAGLKPGSQVAELIPGSGYFTRILSVAVGPKGHVYALPPPKRADAPPDAPDRSAAVRAIAADPHYSNVSVSELNLKEAGLPANVDLVWTSQNYHDFHNVPNLDLAGFNKAIFDALKPGGVFIVLDHVAEAGSGARDTSTLHRIDPETVKKEVVAAGFKFDGESDILRNPNDPHTAKVFDPSIRGKTDQFILKFSKPK
jgi:predicted methyltransferase